MLKAITINMGMRFEYKTITLELKGVVNMMMRYAVTWRETDQTGNGKNNMMMESQRGTLPVRGQ